MFRCLLFLFEDERDAHRHLWKERESKDRYLELGMYAAGSARFRLRNATLGGRIHTYSFERLPVGTYPGMARYNYLPLYGSICAQVLVVPASALERPPLACGRLDLFFVEGGLLLQSMLCMLGGAQLKCYSSNERVESPYARISKAPN